MATYRLDNFALIKGNNIFIYDTNNILRHSILPNESQFYYCRYNVVIEYQGPDKKRNCVLDFSNEIESKQAQERLLYLKMIINASVENMEVIIKDPKNGNILTYINGVWTNSKMTIKENL